MHKSSTHTTLTLELVLQLHSSNNACVSAQNFLYQEFDARPGVRARILYQKHVATTETMNKITQSFIHALLPLQQ